MLRNEAAARTFIVVLMAVALACCAGLAFVYKNSVKPVSARQPMPKIGINWSFPTGSARFMALSQSGRYACLVLTDSTITCYDLSTPSAAHFREGAGSGIHLAILRYSVKVPGADRAVISPDGKYVMAYSYLNPLRGELVFLDPHGSVHWTMDVSGAVWSADVCETRDGARFVVGTGDRHVYLIDIDGKHQRYRRWRASGAVSSIALCESGENVVYGTWQDAGVEYTTDTGKPVWKDEADAASLQMVEPAVSSKRVLIRTLPNRTGVSEGFTFLNSSGEPIWDGVVDPRKNATILCSPDGSYTCLGYEETIHHNNKSVAEKHTALYNASGAKLWEKGSLFFDAAPVLVTNGGYVLVVSREDSLFIVTPTGDPEPSIVLPAPLKSAISSRDGSRALITCSNGKAYILSVVQ